MRVAALSFAAVPTAAAMGHHLITYGREVKSGRARASNYSERSHEDAPSPAVADDALRPLPMT
jgi:hypothetical protein